MLQLFRAWSYFAEILRDDLWDNCLQNEFFFLFFVDQVLLIIFLWRTVFWNLKITETLISWDPLIYLFWRSYLHKQPGIIFFFLKKKIVSRTCSFSHSSQTTNLGLVFFNKLIIFFTFFQCDYLILIKF